MYAEVVVNVSPLKSSLHYHLPDELAGRVVVGHLVTVPLRERMAQGVVVGFVEEPDVPETKPIAKVIKKFFVL